MNCLGDFVLRLKGWLSKADKLKLWVENMTALKLVFIVIRHLPFWQVMRVFISYKYP